MNKAPRRFVQPFIKLRHTLQQQGVEFAGQFQVITCRTWLHAEFIKIEPYKILGQRTHPEFPTVQLYGCVGLLLHRCQRLQVLLQPFACHTVCRNQIDAAVLQQFETEVLTAFKMLYPGITLQQPDRRQEAIPLQAVPVQFARGSIGCGNQGDPVCKQGLQQPCQQHGIGHIGDMELVQT